MQRKGEPAKQLPLAADEVGSVISAKGLSGLQPPSLAILTLLSSWKMALEGGAHPAHSGGG